MTELALATGGILVGILLGFLWWGRRRLALTRELNEVRTRLTSMDFDRQRLNAELETATAQLDLLANAKQSPPGSRPTTDMMVVLQELETNADLENIKGIGPKLALLLAAEGINNLARLANMSDGALDHLGHRLPAVAERIRREKWREQAREILASSGKGQQVANHSSGSAPEDLTIDLKEPDAAVTPEL